MYVQQSLEESHVEHVGCIVFLQGIVVTSLSPVDKAAICGSCLVLLPSLAEMLSICKAYDSQITSHSTS